MFSLKNIPSDFNWKIYLERNIDLPRDYNRRDCINHYIKYGQYEKRVYRENKGFAFVLYSNRPFINCDLFNCVLECLKYKNNEPYIYQKICDNHNKINNIIETYSNDYAKLNKKMYTYSKDNDMPVSFLQIQKVDPSSFEATCQILYNELKSSLINAYESFILILDFSEIYTGGTRSFINNIIYKYSKNNNFLFLRPNNTNLYNIHINNTKILDLNITQIIQFIDLTKNKISKIFFNHAIDFSKDLLNFLLLLPIEKTLVTHDHFFLTNGNPQNTMDEVYNFLSNNVHNNVLNAVDNIISQNINNIYISNKYVYNRFIISELPDFRENDDIKIVTNNKSINILFIGDIHELKGCELVDFLCNDYYKETNIKTFIFGCLSNSVGNNTRRYKNIDEFNELLIDYKPNLIIETSLWPETYSYTLTLSMITQLPILSLKKPYHSVIESRLKNYNNAHFFSSLKELNNLIHEKKQDFFYTVKPVIYFNKFWDNYFNSQHIEFESIANKFNDHSIFNLMENKNVVFITCKVIVSDTVFNYSNTRSIYTYEERLDQTLKTINCVRQSIPNCFIVLIDNSLFNAENDDKTRLKNMVDYFINPCYENNGFLNYYTNECKYKCLGELSQIIYAYYYFFKHVDFTKINHFFKISARYYINGNFNYSNFDNDKIIFKQNKQVTDRTYYYTSFYKLTNNFLPTYFSEILDIYSNKDKYYKNDLEVIFSEKFGKHITLIDELGITQNFACWNISDNI